MGRKKKICLISLTIALLGITIFAVRLHFEIEKKTREAIFDHYIYARNYACMLISCKRKGSEYVYALEKTPNTDAVIEYLQKEGYPITYEIIETDYEKGMKVLQRFRKDHGIEHIEAVRGFFVTSLAGEGYTWKFDGDDTYWYE
uniref:Uncharacterized protein n=1 Tax=Eubacterium cellulosolvens (strain ATCC 43171 / JCM 9499 / 6) TaxID=633697 RepID=I5AS16_EUBC6